MGRIRTKVIKRSTREVMERYGDRFTDNFEHNKQELKGLIDTPSKKMRNKIAGYLTKQKKAKKFKEAKVEQPVEEKEKVE